MKADQKEECSAREAQVSLRARMDLLVEGATHRGIVRNRAPFGLFIELIAGQKDGLLRFDSTPYPEIAKLFQVGDAVEVVVTTVDVDREVVRVQLLPDPTQYDGFWSRKSNAEQQVAPDCCDTAHDPWGVTASGTHSPLVPASR